MNCSGTTASLLRRKVAKGPAGDAGENGDGGIPRELVAREVEALAREAAGVLEDANGDRSDVRDGNLRQRPCRRERRRGLVGFAKAVARGSDAERKSRREDISR